MAGFKQVAKLLGKAVEEAAPVAAKAGVEGAERFLNDEVAFAKELSRINARRAGAGNFELTPEQLRGYLQTKEVPKEPMVPGARKAAKPEPIKALPPEEGPQTLAGPNKLHNPEMSGLVDYAKKPNTAKAIMPMAAAEGLYNDLKGSALGDAATKWSKLKGMVANKLAGQMDLTGGKDPEFQKKASGILSTTLDPVNFIPGVGGVAAGAAEMLADEDEEDSKKLKKQQGRLP